MPGSPETQFQHGTAKLRPAEGCKRALLITIGYSGTRLIHSHTHLSAIKDLTMKYGYAEAGIHVLSDDGNHTKPTHDNIIDALRNLVKGAKPGDRFFFYYCGHGGQIHNKDGRETDRKDELILPSDYIDTNHDGEDSYSVERYQNHILDDELNNILVKSLPVGSQLVALFDCCHSGTMLDLEYYGEDYFEYYGADKSRYAEEPFSEARIFGDDVLKNATQKFMDNIVDSVARPFESGPLLNLSHTQTGRRVTERGLRFRPESANPMTDASPKAHVVSWSSSLDGQKSWQRPQTGGVMSKAFIESLEDNMSPTYEELFHKLSYTSLCAYTPFIVALTADTERSSQAHR